MSSATKVVLGALCMIALALQSCGGGSAVTSTPEAIEPTGVPAATAARELLASTAAPPTPTSVAEGRTLVVTSPENSGPGTLRWALSEARIGDRVTFDPEFFPPTDPLTIFVLSELPHIRQSHLTLDASDAGVVLDGSQVDGDWVAGLQIVSSQGSVIRGLHITNFPGPGIAISGEARDNEIGGDRSAGAAVSGQGNVLIHNAVGVELSTPNTTNNVVVGNLIGTDGTSQPGHGNQRTGIWISEGASGNRIGPDNLVAFNGGCGIEASGEEADRNRITRNRFHDNAASAICLTLGSNGRPLLPQIAQIEWSAGFIAGTACSGCRVEVFSDGGDEAATYEGRVTADADGWFLFENGTAFTGPNVTVTATDRAGNTSEFSRPVSAGGGPLTLQEGNRQPPRVLLPKRSGDLADNGISATFVGPQLWEEVVHGHEYLSNYLLDLGVKRINTSLNEVEPPITWQASEYEIPPEYDRLIDTMRENGVEINYMLHFWDKEGHARDEMLSTPRFQTEEQLDDFVEYVRFIVRHFRGRVAYYTLWTEPDNCHQGRGIKCIRARDYIELARRVIPVIRAEDPQAKVSVAPVVLFFERDFVPTVLRSEVGPMFDVVQWHGQYDVRPDNEYYGSYYYDYPSIVEGIRQVGAENGFEGEFWSTDIWWCSEQFPGEDPGDQPWRNCRGSDKVAAKYNARAILVNLGMGISAGMENGYPPDSAPWSHPSLQLLSMVMAGASPTDLELEISGAPADPRLARYVFEYPNGDTLIALWTDGVAVESDPGVPVTVTLAGFGGSEVSAIDVMYGYEQPLIASEEGAMLIVRDLLLKDYPVILRISPRTSER